jgi:chromosome segregation ATPase
MWKQLLEIAKQVFALTRKAQQHESDIELLQQELKEVRQEIQSLRQEMYMLARLFERTTSDNQHHRESMNLEHKNLLLQMENTLLKFERRLPPTRSTEEESG